MEISFKCMSVEELKDITKFLSGCLDATEAAALLQAQADRLGVSTGELEAAIKNANQKG